MTTTAAPQPLASHVHLIRATAALIEQAGVAGLAVYPEPGEIVIQVPQTAGDLPSRSRALAQLAALIGGTPEPDPHPGATHGWISARGQFAGHLVQVFTPAGPQAAP